MGGDRQLSEMALAPALSLACTGFFRWAGPIQHLLKSKIAVAKAKECVQEAVSPFLKCGSPLHFALPFRRMVKRQRNLKPRTDERRWGHEATWILFALVLAFAIGGLLTKATVEAWAWPSLDGPVLSQEIARVAGGEIYGPITMGQSLICPRNGLYRIDILLATYNRRNDRDLVFHLRHAPGEDDLVTIRFNASEVEDNSFFPLTFPPIPDSGGQNFYFFLESPDSEPGNAITVWGVTENVYPEGRSYRNHRRAGGEVAFRIYAKGYSLLDWVSDFLTQNALQIIMFSLYSALVFSVIGLLRHQRKSGTD